MTIRHKVQAGVTLIELILSMLIIGIALTGVLKVINLTVSHSADPEITYQAAAIAESYMDEILLQSYSDPNGADTGETRASFDDVSDYNGLNDTGAHNQQGALISSLSQYNVAVTVSAPIVLTGNVSVKEITITVSTPGLQNLNLVGYKASY